MFYGGKLIDSDTVGNHRPSYFNGSNTRKIQNTEKIIELLDNKNENDEKLSVKEEKLLKEKSEQKGNSASSFLENLNLLYAKKNPTGNTDKNNNNNENNDKNDTKNGKKKTKIDFDESNITMKPFLFFDLVSSQDISGSSSGNNNASMSRMNIGKKRETFFCLYI